VAAAVVHQNWGLLELRPVDLTLEDVFVRPRHRGEGEHGMSSFWPIFKRELRAYFVSPIAYVVMVMFLTIAGYFFYSSFAFFNFIGFQAMSNPMMARNLNVTEGVLRPLYGNLGVVLLFIMPLLTMRLFAEEKKQGTIELLLTYPVRDWRPCWRNLRPA